MTHETKEQHQNIPGAGELNYDNLSEHLKGFKTTLADLMEPARQAKEMLDKLPSANILGKKTTKIGDQIFTVSHLDRNGILLEFATPEECKKHYDTQFPTYE